MPRLTKFQKQRAALPPPGTALLMPLQDGRFGVCRVIRLTTEAEIAQQGAVQALVAIAPWIGDDSPDLSDPLVRDIQVLTHHSFKNERCVLWVSGAPPESFRPIGHIEPTPEEIELACWSSSGWQWFPLQLLSQWRWDHERAEVTRSDEAKRERVAEANRYAEEEYRAYLDGLTLEGLLDKPRFQDWNGLAPARATRSCRQIVQDTIRKLVELGPNRRTRDVVRILRNSVLDINEIDDQNGHFIETSLREELAEEFDEIAYTAGLRAEAGLALRWADW